MRLHYTQYGEFSERYDHELSNIQAGIAQLSVYVKELTVIGVSSGQFHDDLEILQEKIQEIPDRIEELRTKVTGMVTHYLSDMNTAQNLNGEYILYPKDYPDGRDYSEEAFVRLRRVCESTDYDSNFLRKLSDFNDDLVARVLKWLGETFHWIDAKAIQKQVLEFNDVTKRGLDLVQRRLNDTEDRYRSVAEVFVLSLQDLYVCVELLVEAVSQSPGEFSMSGFSTRFDRLLDSMDSKLKSIRFSYENPSDEDIEAFISSGFADEFLNAEINIIYDFLDELAMMEMSDPDFWRLIVYQMFDVAEGQILTRGDFDKLVRKKELMELISVLAATYVYEGSDQEAAVNGMNAVLGAAKGKGESLYEYLNSHRDENGNLLLDGRTKEAKRFLEFLDKMEKLGVAIDGAKIGVDALCQMFMEYDKNLSFLDSFERNSQLSGEMQECFDELRAVYEKEVTQSSKEILMDVAEFTMNNVVYELPVMDTVGKVKDAIGILGKVTGDGARTEAQLELLIYGYDVVNSAKSAYASALEKLSNCSPDAPEYAGLMQDYENCYSIYKTSTVRIFEKMATASSGDKRDYYNYCASEISAVTMPEYGDFKLITYGEYCEGKG